MINLVHPVITHHRVVGRDHHGFQAVYLLKFVGFRIRSASHAGQLLVHAEKILEGDRGQSLVFSLNVYTLFGFDGLMQTVRPAATGHQTAGKLVDNDDFVILHDIVLVTVIQGLRTQSCIQVMH